MSGQLDLGGTEVSAEVRAARDALAVEALVEPIMSSLAEQGMAELYDTIENPLVVVLARMEHVGIAVDRPHLEQLYQKLTADVARLGAEVRTISGHDDLNVNSTIQLRQILFTERGLTPVKKTKTGASTDAGSLEKLQEQWPEFIGPLLQYREVEKLRGTYGEGLLLEVAADGRIHATFNQTVARTGRLSSDRPNLHNIPVRRDEGRQFRRVFVPAPGYVMLVADYNQIELRCIAHLAADPGLIAAFTSGQDIHNATAARVFSVDPGAVTIDQRSKAKMVSYGLAYGMEAYGLGQRLNIPTEEAAVILDAYFEAFPNVKSYMDRTVVEARKVGYTETLFGRRRPIPELLDGNWRIRQAGERQAMNAGIQGSSRRHLQGRPRAHRRGFARAGERGPPRPPGSRRGAPRGARGRARRDRPVRRRADAPRRRPRRPPRSQLRLGPDLGRRQVLTGSGRLGSCRRWGGGVRRA